MERRAAPSHGLCPYKKYELLFGEIIHSPDYTGYASGESVNLEAFTSDEMLADWAANRTELLKFWRSGEHTMDLPWLFARGWEGGLPWGERVLQPQMKG
jgi:hypothetical protein